MDRVKDGDEMVLVLKFSVALQSGKNIKPPLLAAGSCGK